MSSFTQKIASEVGGIFGREAAYVLNSLDIQNHEIELISQLNAVFENLRLIDINNIYNLRVNYFDFVCAITEDVSYMNGVMELSKLGLKKDGYFVQIIKKDFAQKHCVKLNVPHLELLEADIVLVDPSYSCRIYRKI